jgi:hypothetical protein
MMKSVTLAIAALALVVTAANSVEAETQAGVSAAVRGDIDLSTSGQAAHKAASGDEVFLGDEISSHDESGMQLMLLDETVFTIGENTELTVDEFIYDPATGAGQVAASLTKGVFRFVTGKIAQGNPEDMAINLPVGTIGIRGTIGAASMLGGIAAVVLLGPGPDNNANSRPGHLEVSAQGTTVNLTRPRYGTIIEPGMPPSLPVLFTDAQIGVILSAVAPPPAADKPSDAPAAGAATAAANQNMADANTTSVSFLPAGNPPDNQNQVSATSGSGGDDGISISRFADIRGIQTGQFDYSGSGTFTQTLKLGSAASIDGTFSVTLRIDFGAQHICAGGCLISVNTSSFGGNISDSTTPSQFDYANETEIFAAGTLDSDDLDNSNFTGTSVSLVDSSGIIANQGTIDIKYADGSGNEGSGSGITDPRQ